MAGRRVCSKLAVARYVADCARRGEPPRISELAQKLHRHGAHLSRTFLSDYGTTLGEYMKAQQVRCAARMLRETDKTTAQVAYSCGFGTRRTFFRVFRHCMGMSPQQYRDRRRH